MFHRRYLNLRPTDPAGGMLSIQPPRLNSAMRSMSLIKLLKSLWLLSELVTWYSYQQSALLSADSLPIV